MLAIISQLFFFLGLVIVILLVARKTPKIANELENKEEPLEVQIENHIGRSFFAIPWDKIDLATERFLEKLMRRLHIWTMKIDAFLQKKLEGLKNKNKGKSFVEEINGTSLVAKETEEPLDLSNIDLETLDSPLTLTIEKDRKGMNGEIGDLNIKEEEELGKAAKETEEKRKKEKKSKEK